MLIDIKYHTIRNMVTILAGEDDGLQFVISWRGNVERDANGIVGIAFRER